MHNPQIGEYTTIRTQSIGEVDCLVVGIRDISENEKLVSLKFPDGNVYDYYYCNKPDYSSFLNYTGMPAEYSRKGLDSFLWSIYKEDIN